MGGQKVTRRQKDISRVLREKKKRQPLKNKKSVPTKTGSVRAIDSVYDSIYFPD